MNKRNFTWSEARDTGNKGMDIEKVLIDFSIANGTQEAHSFIRSGMVSIGNYIVKDINYHMNPGFYHIKLSGESILDLTIL